MRKCYVKIKTVLRVAKSFLKRKNTLTKRTRGRPQKYPPHVILTLLALKELYNLSLREVLITARWLLNLKVPALSTFHYRIKAFPKELLEEFIAYLGSLIERKATQSAISTNPELLYIVDGTGEGYGGKRVLKYQRGLEEKEVRSHVRLVLVEGCVEGVRYVKGARVGEAYSSEVRLAEVILKGCRLSGGGKLLGDRGYDSVRILEILKSQGVEPLIRMKCGRNQRVRHSLRVESQWNVEKNKKLYRKRNRIESLFSNLKDKFGGYVKARNENVAKVLVLVRVLLYNFGVLGELEEENFCVWFGVLVSKANFIRILYYSVIHIY